MSTVIGTIGVGRTVFCHETISHHEYVMAIAEAHIIIQNRALEILSEKMDIFPLTEFVMEITDRHSFPLELIKLVQLKTKLDEKETIKHLPIKNQGKPTKGFRRKNWLHPYKRY